MAWELRQRVELFLLMACRLDNYTSTLCRVFVCVFAAIALKHSASASLIINDTFTAPDNTAADRTDARTDGFAGNRLRR